MMEPSIPSQPQLTPAQNTATAVPQPQNQSVSMQPPQVVTDGKPQSSKKLILVSLLLLVLLIIVGAGIVVLLQQNSSSAVPVAVVREELVATPTELPTTSPVSEPEQTAQTTTVTIAECDEFPSKLETCTAYTCQFTHPLTGSKMTKTVVGLVNNTCQYTEQMPNNGQMVCNYSEEMSKAVAQYQRDLATAQTVGTEISTDLQPSQSETQTTYTINGVAVANPSQEALTSGQCVVTGY